MEGSKGKVVAITGGGSGLGEATALLLASRGARVVVGDRSPERLEALVARIKGAGGEAASVKIDVRRREDVAALVAAACQHFGHLDVLFSNAGVMPISPLDELRVDDWESMIDVNIKGVLNGIAAALPIFRHQGFGHFIHTASTSAYKVVPNQAVYAGTKVAVRAISEGLRQEVGDKIRVTVISPGMMRTNFTDHVNSAKVKEQLAASREKFAMPPEAVARAIAFAIEQPNDVDVNELVIRATAQP